MNYIYIHTNKKNGKVYIGQTNQDPEKRWGKGRGYKGCKSFYSAIKKYGWDGFEHEILISGVDDSTVNFWETRFINFYDSMNPDKGYNLRSGGKKCFKFSDETIQKISLASKGNQYRKGKKCSEESKQKMSSSHKGKKCSEESKQKMSSSHKGKNLGKKLSEETKQKISLTKKGKTTWNKGISMSKETKQKMSLAKKGKKKKPMSEETKQKMSLAKKGKHWKLDPITNKRIYY